MAFDQNAQNGATPGSAIDAGAKPGAVLDKVDAGADAGHDVHADVTYMGGDKALANTNEQSVMRAINRVLGNEKDIEKTTMQIMNRDTELRAERKNGPAAPNGRPSYGAMKMQAANATTQPKATDGFPDSTFGKDPKIAAENRATIEKLLATRNNPKIISVAQLREPAQSKVNQLAEPTQKTTTPDNTAINVAAVQKSRYTQIAPGRA